MSKPPIAHQPIDLSKSSSELVTQLKEQQATGILPVSVALEVIVEVLSRVAGEQAIEQPSNALQVYKRAVRAMRGYFEANPHEMPDAPLFPELVSALAAVDVLEGE